jgi:UrcA family protein
VNRDLPDEFIKLNQEIAMKVATNARSATLPSMIAAALVAIACAANAGTAQASEPGQPPLTKKVAYGDLNLNNEQDAKVLYHRLRFAAREVCTPFESGELDLRRIWQTCVDHAVASAVAQINRPMVTIVHNRSVNRSSAG